jgi:hypothetical protein
MDVTGAELSVEATQGKVKGLAFHGAGPGDNALVDDCDDDPETQWTFKDTRFQVETHVTGLQFCSGGGNIEVDRFCPDNQVESEGCYVFPIGDPDIHERH